MPLDHRLQTYTLQSFTRDGHTSRHATVYVHGYGRNGNMIGCITQAARLLDKERADSAEAHVITPDFNISDKSAAILITADTTAMAERRAVRELLVKTVIPESSPMIAYIVNVDRIDIDKAEPLIECNGYKIERLDIAGKDPHRLIKLALEPGDQSISGVYEATFNVDDIEAFIEHLNVTNQGDPTDWYNKDETQNEWKDLGSTIPTPTAAETRASLDELINFLDSVIPASEYTPDTTNLTPINLTRDQLVLLKTTVQSAKGFSALPLDDQICRILDGLDKILQRLRKLIGVAVGIPVKPVIALIDNVSAGLKAMLREFDDKGPPSDTSD